MNILKYRNMCVYKSMYVSVLLCICVPLCGNFVKKNIYIHVFIYRYFLVNQMSQTVKIYSKLWLLNFFYMKFAATRISPYICAFFTFMCRLYFLSIYFYISLGWVNSKVVLFYYLEIELKMILFSRNFHHFTF